MASKREEKVESWRIRDAKSSEKAEWDQHSTRQKESWFKKPTQNSMQGGQAEQKGRHHHKKGAQVDRRDPWAVIFVARTPSGKLAEILKTKEKEINKNNMLVKPSIHVRVAINLLANNPKNNQEHNTESDNSRDC